MNPTKRKFIREARDLWYEICLKRYAPDADRLDELGELLRHAVTKSDLDKAVEKMVGLVREVADRPGATVRQKATEISSYGAMIGPGVGANRLCKVCGTSIGLYIGDQGHCPNCGTAW